MPTLSFSFFLSKYISIHMFYVFAQTKTWVEPQEMFFKNVEKLQEVFMFGWGGKVGANRRKQINNGVQYVTWLSTDISTPL